MKSPTLLATIIVGMATVAYGQSPLRTPAISMVTVAEKQWTEEFKAEPPGKCKGTINKFFFQPSIVLGTDAAGKTFTFRFYKIAKQWNNEKQKSEAEVSRVSDIPIYDATATLKPITHEFMDWKCSCCRKIDKGEYLGWYAELLDGEEVIYKTQSSMTSQGTTALQKYLKANK